MGQMGFFDIANRYAGLDAKNDPLARIDAVVPWENFRARLEAIWRKPAEERKSPAGRKPWDAVAMFKAIVLCELYNLSDDQVEYQLRDRLSFMRFVGFGLEDKVPDAKTVWLYREQLARAGMVEALFETSTAIWRSRATWRWAARSSTRRSYRSPSSATAVTTTRGSRMARRRRAGRTSRPSGRRRTRTHGGPWQEPLRLNHVNVDRRHKLVRRYQVTDAAVHDSQVVEDILDPDNTASDVWADSAYRSAEIEAKLKEKGLNSRIHRKGHRDKPLSEREKRGNKARSKVRARVEHVFGAQSNDMGGTLV